MSFHKFFLSNQIKNNIFKRKLCDKHTSNDIRIEKITTILILLGGIAGGGYGAQFGYYKTRDNEPYNICVGVTTCISICGACLGSAIASLTPIILPIATIVGIVRYIDTPSTNNIQHSKEHNR